MSSKTNLIVMCEFAPWWLAAWGFAHRCGLSRVQRFLEDRPAFIPSKKLRSVVRSEIRNGDIRWSYYTSPTSESVETGWPDTQAH